MVEMSPSAPIRAEIVRGGSKPGTLTVIQTITAWGRRTFDNTKDKLRTIGTQVKRGSYPTASTLRVRHIKHTCAVNDRLRALFHGPHGADHAVQRRGGDSQPCLRGEVSMS